jgi:hypothetical protein
MEQKYYLPINSKSLAHYFGCACIKQCKYFDNKPEDLQDRLNEFLLITTNFGTQQTDCCLEIIFTKQEMNDLIDSLFDISDFADSLDSFINEQADITIHLFSNILDIDDYSQKHLIQLIESTMSGKNYFVCASPYIDEIKTEKVDESYKSV